MGATQNVYDKVRKDGQDLHASFPLHVAHVKLQSEIELNGISLHTRLFTIWINNTTISENLCIAYRPFIGITQYLNKNW